MHVKNCHDIKFNFFFKSNIYFRPTNEVPLTKTCIDLDEEMQKIVYIYIYDYIDIKIR